MLQQTRVAAALPYYDRFVARWPDPAALAEAPLDDVLHAWAGLGYYRRARQLHAAAAIVAREHQGNVPDDPAAFARLPGVGRYTLGAVLSIGFDRPLPVLDGNVARVLSRIEAIPASVREPAGSRTLWRRAATLVPMRGAGDWNQALMELGALVCLPRAPRCGECPVARWCRARMRGRVAAFPPVAPRRAPELAQWPTVLVERAGKILLVRKSGTLLDGLWETPATVATGLRQPSGRLREILAALGVEVRKLRRTGHVIRYAITHRRIEAEVWRAEGVRMAPPAARGWATRWVDPERPDLALSAMGRKALALARAGASLPARSAPRRSATRAGVTARVARRPGVNRGG